jgi:hypothetical protein
MADTITIFYETSGLEVALRLDIIEQETFSGDVELPRHPVEKGAPVNDHVRPQPQPLEVRGSISSTSMTDEEGTDRDRLSRTLDVLTELAESADLVTVVTPLRVREHMHLKSFRATHDTGLPGTLGVSLNFEPMNVVESQRVKVTLPKKAPDRTKAAANGGKQVASATSSEAKRKSLAARGVDALLGR